MYLRQIKCFVQFIFMHQLYQYQQNLHHFQALQQISLQVSFFYHYFSNETRFLLFSNHIFTSNHKVNPPIHQSFIEVSSFHSKFDLFRFHCYYFTQSFYHQPFSIDPYFIRILIAIVQTPSLSFPDLQLHFLCLLIESFFKR